MTSGIAAQLYTVREFMRTPAEIAQTLKRVKAIGYPAVQLSGLGPIAPAELAAILDGEGLIAAATHTSFDRLMNDLPAVIDDHHRWKCRNVALGAMPGEFQNEAGYLAFAKIASDIARKLAEADLTFSYHNHSFELERYGEKTGLALLYDHSDSQVLAEIDTFWIQHGGADPAVWIERVTGRMVIVHLKDMTMCNGEQIMAEVGEGNLNWPRILQACRDCGVQWYTVEQDICQRDPFESLTISLRNLQAMGVCA